MKLTRYDTATISKFEFDSNGFLRVKDVPISRTGVFPYLDGKGSIKMEAKLPDDLLSDLTVDSANGKPITDDHPSEPVTAKNTNKYMRGITADNAHVDGDKIKVDMLITDNSLIDEVKDAENGKQELSIGFKTDLVPVAGEFKGMHYDAMQRNIQINHVAVVKHGRAGVRLTDDSAEMVQDYAPEQQEGTEKMEDITRRLADGSDITVKKEDADKVAKLDSDNTANSKKLADLEAKIKALTEERDKLKGDNSEAQKGKEQAEAKADSAEKELEKYKEQMTTDALDSAINERMELIEDVKQYVGDSLDYKGKSAKELKLEAIKSVNGVDLADKSDVYIDAYFDSIKANNKPVASGYFGEQPKADSSDTNSLDRYNLAK